MARIFISYSRKDEVFAHRLAADLDRLGADVWVDVDDIPAGMKWSTAIQQGLETCEVMIVIISPHSMASVNVEDEWQYYLDHHKLLVPVLWQPANVHFQLSRIQYINFHTQNYDTAFAQLHAEMNRKGIRLAPLPPGSSSVSIPAQKPLPVRRKPFPRSYLAAGLLAVALVIAAIAVLLYGLLGSGDDNKPTSTSPAVVNQPSETPVSTIATERVLPETQFYLDLTATAAARPTNTPTATATFTSTPDYDATYWAEATKAMATIQTGWTDTPTVTDTPVPTQTPSPTATREPTTTPVPAATLDPLQTKLEEARNFSGTNEEWEPFVQTLDGVEMMLVPAGCFMMGSENGDSDEKPTHEVCFEEPFWIDRTEVTNAQFAAFNGQAASSSNWTGDSLPQELITWTEANAFCERRDTRLPTEAEWEYAARGPDGLVYPWGNEFVADNVVYSGNSGNQTAAVGSRAGGVSWVGALDLSGNVWEWVADWYETYPSERQVNPTGPANGEERVLRGGSWNGDDYNLRAAFRLGFSPDYWNGYLGFRCARSAGG